MDNPHKGKVHKKGKPIVLVPRKVSEWINHVNSVGRVNPNGRGTKRT